MNETTTQGHYCQLVIDLNNEIKRLLAASTAADFESAMALKPELEWLAVRVKVSKA